MYKLSKLETKGRYNNRYQRNPENLKEIVTFLNSYYLAK